MEARLANLRHAGFCPTGVIDAGAFEGDWTKKFWQIWPDVPSCLIEPQLGKQELLGALAPLVPGSLSLACAVGAQTGMVRFHLAETNSGISSNLDEDGVTVECRTLDDILGSAISFRPNFLKLDLQGHELEALKGCKHHLEQFEVVLLEVSVLRIGDVPIFHDVDQFLEERGYRFYDAVPEYYRPLDGALWQMDVFYVRKVSKLIGSRSWS